MSCSLLLSALCPAQSFFRTNQKSGLWWFQRQSKPFWSLGVDCTELGDAGKPGNPNYDGRALFGSEAAWATDTLAKFRVWGVNTLGGWSDDEAFDGRLPYTVVLHLGAYDMAPWHDLWSEKTQGLIAKAAADLVPKTAHDPMLLGYFTDNELGWWDDTLFISYFAFGADSPGKQKLVSVLKAHYHNDFLRFAREWGTKVNDWGDLLGEKKIALKPGTQGIKAVQAFNYALARHYYELVSSLVKRYDPHHLILGDRYCQYYNLETVRASRGLVDVVSTNAGADWLDGSYTKSYFDNLHRMTGKPVMVTEFYFSAKQNLSGDGNSGTAFPTVETQKERAKGFAGSLNDLAKRPYMVGAHWFQFHDEPPLGRGDGENFNFGLVSVKGQVYEEMAQVLRRFDARKVHASPTLDKGPIGTPLAPSHPMDDFMLRWNRERAYVTSPSTEQWADLYATYDSRNLYVGLVPMEFMDPNLYQGGKLPPADLPRLELKVGGWKGSVVYGGAKAITSQGIAECREKGGLKHFLVLRIPASTLGQKELKHGQRLSLRASLDSHGRGYRMVWNQELTLR
jgi:hypothetical protein